jgi:diguanylate cyclase
MAEAAADKDWKDSYREVVAELEQKERAWRQLEDLLRRSARKLAITAMGQSPVLDDQLEAILDTLREDADIEHLAEALEDLGGTLNALPRVKDASEGDQQVALIIANLVERMAESPALAATAAELKRLHGIATASNDWAQLVRHMAASLSEHVSALAAQKQELEAFLEAMTEQLRQFDDWTSWNRGVDERRQTDSADLEHTVENEMQGISVAVAETSDIEQLKARVQARLDAVKTRIRQFCEDESARQAEADERNRELTREIGSLRAKTNDLGRLVEDREQKLLLDALTQVHSRYAYEHRLREEFGRWERQHEPVSFALWDIDHFKLVNDRFGHSAGDRLLQLVARILDESRRAGDFVARIGGEEFVLLLPGTELVGAQALTERIRGRIAETPFHYHGEPQRITVSCGIAEFRDGDSPETVFERADAALYRAKDQGRNCCVAA